MLTNEKIIYNKSFKELYTVIEILSPSEISRIPYHIIENIKSNMDTSYEFSIDKSKSLLDQNLMPQTQALIIELYQKYLSPEVDKEKWEKYNRLCYEINEKEKLEQYNPKDLFPQKECEQKQTQLIVLEKHSFIKKIIRKLKSMFNFKKIQK